MLKRVMFLTNRRIAEVLRELVYFARHPICVVAQNAFPVIDEQYSNCMEGGDKCG